MASSPLPRIPFGAVYFRKSNPPESQWERDYETAAEDGMNVFRHWFLWSAIERAPDTYDWDAYDRQMDLAAKNGMKTIIAEMIGAAPQWAYRLYPHAHVIRRDGTPVEHGYSPSCAAGGFPGLCLDNRDYRERAGLFLTCLAERYKDHPALGGYDVWNECNFPENVCYCPATIEEFREWLRMKYEDLRTLAEAWRFYGLADWNDALPPRRLGPYPQTLDWLEFREDRAEELLKWRVDIIRAIDPDHPITAHGIAGTLRTMSARCSDDWRAARWVDSYGVTWGSCRHGDEPWKQWHAMDMTRAAAAGKDFWHAEAYAGPLWLAPQVEGKPRNEGRIARPQDVRLWDLTSFAAGARGLFYLRWRPLLDGPLFGAFGPYANDGSRTDRSEESRRIAEWVRDSAPEGLWDAHPARGEAGILIVPEAHRFCAALNGDAGYFARSLEGVYQAFFDANVQPDWVRLDEMDRYKLIYLPFPVCLSSKTAEALVAYVRAGGRLVSEGCPGYFDERGHVGERQPNLGLDQLFGAVETDVEFAPDLAEEILFEMGPVRVYGGLFQQKYTATTGEVAGVYIGETSIAVVDNEAGRGRTRLIGTFPGYGYARHPLPAGAHFFASLLDWAGVPQHVKTSDPRVKARIHANRSDVYVWIVNPSETRVDVILTLSVEWGPFTRCRTLWGAIDASVKGRQIHATVGARNATVVGCER